MKQCKYIVHIPNPDNRSEIRTFEFGTAKQVCEILQIGRSSMYNIINGEFKCLHSNTKYLDGVKIERIHLPAKSLSKPEKKDDTIEKQRAIFDKLIANCKA